jgi:hypothetical protein
MNNRYLIYNILGRKVEITSPSRFGGFSKISGIVDRVCRNIFDDVVEITLSGEYYSFREPAAIVSDGTDIVFLYGDVDTDEDSKPMLSHDFDGYKESIHEHLRRTSSCPVTKTHIKVGELKQTPGSRWRNKLVVS